MDPSYLSSHRACKTDPWDACAKDALALRMSGADHVYVCECMPQFFNCADVIIKSRSNGSGGEYWAHTVPGVHQCTEGFGCCLATLAWLGAHVCALWPGLCL